MSGSAISVSKATTPSSPWWTSVMATPLAGCSTHPERGHHAASGRHGSARMSEHPQTQRPRCAAPRVRRPRARHPGPRARPDRDVPALARRRPSASGLHEPNAMVVSTVSAEGRPSSRMVLLKGLDTRGFVFYTNYESRKGREIDANPHVSLLFPWHDLQRQVRVEGTASRVSRGGERGLLRRAAPRVAARGLGVAAVAGGGLPRRPRRAVRRRAGAVRRRGRRTPAAVAGAGSGSSRSGGVLAGPQGPDARPAALPPRRTATRTRRGPWSGSRRSRRKPLVSECSLT